MVYDELPSDSIGTRLEGSIMNAVVVVLGIATMTFMFVLCFKYGFYKVTCIDLEQSTNSCLVSIFLAGFISHVDLRYNGVCIMGVTITI